MHSPMSRVQKLVSVALHAARSARARRRIEALAGGSAVARAILAVLRDRFTEEERRVLRAIDEERQRLAARNDEIVWSIEDPIDAAAAPAPARQRVGPSVTLTAVRPTWGILLYALAREVRPETCLEMGTSFGVSGAYIQAGLRQTGAGRFMTLEGSRARADIATDTFGRLGFTGFEVRVGDFDRQLAPALTALGSVDLAFVDGNHRLAPTTRYDQMIRDHMPTGGVIAYDDIRWSREMVEAWGRIAARPGTRNAFDLFRVGIVELGPTSAGPARLDAWLGLSAHVSGVAIP
jgi:predicted O-methyltransferase YrrM